MGPDGDVYVADVDTGLRRFTADGSLAQVYPTSAVSSGFGIAVGGDGALWASDFAPDPDVVRKIDPDTGAVLATVTGLGQPTDIEVDAAGRVHVLDFNSGTVRTYTPDATLVEVSDPVASALAIALDRYGRLFVSGGSQAATFHPEPVTVTGHLGAPGDAAVEAGFAAATADHSKERIDFDGDGFDGLAAHTFTPIPSDHYRSQGVTLTALDARSVGGQSWAHSPPIGAWQTGFSGPARPYSFTFDQPVASFGMFANDVEGAVTATVHLTDGRREFFTVPAGGGADTGRFVGFTAAADVIERIELASHDYHIIDDVEFGRIAGDGTAPTVEVASPSDGARYTLGQAVTAAYTCADDGGSGIASCVAGTPAGGTVDTSTAGTHSFRVTATDGAGNATDAVATYRVLAGDVDEEVTGPAVVTTDPGGLGASPEVPVQTRIAVPAGVAGPVSVVPGPLGAPPAGFVLLGSELQVSAPPAPDPSTPHVVEFTIDARTVGALPPDQVTVFRNGAPVPACVTPSGAAPDPCVAGRVADPTGDVVVTVRTSQFSSWSFGRRAFVALSAGPDSLAQGTNRQIVVSGDGFRPGATVRISGKGVSVTSTTLRAATALEVVVTVGAAAATGARDVVVTNPGPSVATCSACFTVNARPAVASVTPASRPAGVTGVTVRVTGSGFQPGAVASFSGTGVAVGATTFVDANRLDLEISVDPSAAPGNRAITVANPDGGTVTRASGITVSAAPAVTAVSRSSLRQRSDGQRRGHRVGIPRRLRHERRDCVVRRRSDGPVGRADVGDEADDHGGDRRDAVPGPRDLVVVNPDGGSATCLACVTVVADPGIVSVTPPALPRGTAAREVVITGFGFLPGATVKVPGGGVTVTAATVVDERTLRVGVTVGASAALGARDIAVINPDTGTTSCTGCLAVNARPAIGTLTPGSVARGGVASVVELTGSGFQDGVLVTVAGGATATVTSVTPTLVTFEVGVAPDAAPGRRAVTVTNPDGGTVTRANALRVT